MKRLLRYLLVLGVWTGLFGSFELKAQNIGCTIGDCQNGKGRFIFDNGDKYIGEFKNSLPHGRGIYQGHNGSTYKGPFIKGMRQGYGSFNWSSGDQYIGEYLHNVRHGEGVYIFADGRQQKGIWDKGVFVHEIVESPTQVVQVNSQDSLTNNPSKNEGKYLQSALVSPLQSRTALLIGNSNYRKTPLKNPVNDAYSMAQALQKAGFDVVVYTDIDQKTMKKAIREFGEQLKNSGGVGLFYYAGHGLQADGRNFLLPTDASISKIQDIEFESVDLGRLLSEFEYAQNDMNIMILDACRDNPYKDDFQKSKYASYNGLAAIGTAPYNSFIAFSTAPGSVALDGKGTNSLYTQALIAALQVPGRPLEEVFKLVRKQVRLSSEGRQIPWESSSVEDDFYFLK
jgi:hypothetical protein